MGGRLSLAAEVLARADQALAKKIEPDLIDSHTRRQRIILVYQPSSKGEPVDPLLAIDWMQHPGYAGFNWVGKVEERTSVLPMSFSRFWQFFHHQGCGAVAF